MKVDSSHSEQANTAGRAGWLGALALTATITRQRHRTLPVVIDEVAERFGETPALLSTGECFSHAGLAQRVNRYARWALAHGVEKGARVGLLMPNRPEYLAAWLGVSAVGGVVALLNTNLRGAALAHCIATAAPTHIIVAAELLELVKTAAAHLTTETPLWIHGGEGDCNRIDRVLERYAPEPLSEPERREVTIEEPALYIYTSGTTGLPKAAVITHQRLMMWTHWFAGMIGISPSDRMYDCLPMYHSVGGVVAPGAALVAGGSVVIRDQFSAGRFWDDITAWDCTLFQYIGELCRYLLGTPPHPLETAHRIRLCCGNGLRLDVWQQFQHRFRIPQILEFYAATEGNVSLYNWEQIPGALGRIPGFLAHRFPIALIKFDVDRGVLVRDKHGRCVRCGVDETGEAIGRIAQDASAPGGRFDGYSHSTDTEKKVLRDVFAAGDAWFRTGDLMRKDERGYFYFVDRIGDTFRWKGENVSTCEVETAITECPEIAEANVYGVAIPGTEGRAGMAALVLRCGAKLDLQEIYRHLAARLPHYARPLFVRIRRDMETTPTFKHKKSELVREGYDPQATEDAIYFADPASGGFVPVDGALYALIRNGRIRC